MIKKKFQISKEEFIEFSKYTMVNTKFKLVLLTGIVLFIGSVALTFNKGAGVALLTSFILFLIYFIVVFSVLLISTPLMAKKVYTKNKIGEFMFDLEFNANSIKQNKDTYFYKDLRKVKETKLAYHFYLEQKQIILVPKRVFDEKENEMLKDILRNAKDLKKLKLLSANKSEK